MLRQAIAALLLAGAAVSGAAQVHYDAGSRRVDLSADGEPLGVLLAAIERQTGVTFRLPAAADVAVSDRFTGLSLEQALRRLLRQHNFVMRYRRDGDGRWPSRVLVVGLADTGAAGGRGRPAAAALPSAASAASAVSGPAQLTLRRQRGHYVARGSVNGRAVALLIDTGATTVALSEALARELKLPAGRRRPIETANGRADGHEVVLSRVEFGPMRLRDVRAVVLPGLNLGDRVLLGMNVLSRFDIDQRGDTLVLRERR